MKKTDEVHQFLRKAAKRGLKRGRARCRRVHVARPSSAREILSSLGISPSEIRAALKAIDS